MGNPTLATATFLLSIVLAPAIASQADTTSRPQKPDDAAQKQARRWVTFLELDNRRAEAANGLLKMGAQAVPALVQALNNPRPVVAQTVAHILRVLGSQAVAAKARLTALSKSDNKQLGYLARYALAGIQSVGITLVADRLNSRVLEMDQTGNVVRTLADVYAPWSAERLPNGNFLICCNNAKVVMEVTAKGEVVWSYSKLKAPHNAQRLPNGNTLIADGSGSGVLEVDRAGKTVWKYDKGKIQAMDAKRLVNGNTLIVVSGHSKVIEVAPKGGIVWEHNPRRDAIDADRLANGNTLITLSDVGSVIEVTPKGKVVYELKGLNSPNDADRLPNGHTLVAQVGEVSEFDAKGKKIWSAKVLHPGKASRY